LTALATTIGEAIDSRGQVVDHASDRLATLRRAIAEDSRRIREVFERILKQRRFLKMLQYASTTFHNDRLVLPLKAEYRGRIPGIVHRSSDSGATLFIEPAAAVEINNAIIKLRVREQEEVGRILSGLAKLVHEHEDPILQALDAAGVLDLIAAKTRYAAKRQARCPMISDGRLLDVKGARHPVLLSLFEQQASAGSAARQVVPIDLRLGDDFDLLVITGPNTGGKTVSLKTAGLLALMTQAGIPIPVDPGSTLPVYSQIFVDVGDEQSLEQSLSTFSAHLTNTLHVLKHADEQSLVLMDELGAGTDPDEGSAIGRAIMEELLARRCSALVTTHLSQLKAVAYQLDRVDNACAEFDLESLRPTYRLRMGEPGNSQAIAIAERLGVPAPLVQRARGHLAGQARALSAAIEGTLQTRRRAEAARLAAAEERLQAERSREAYDRKVRDLEAQERARQLWSSWVDGLQPGAWVYVRPFAKCARVVRMKLHRQCAVVSDGNLDLEVPLSALARPDDDQVAEASQPA
jgi:DNA mismatch repair protein MutS2